jgi:hypothetical protein
VNESVVACPAVLALELADGERLQRLTLTRDEAQTLAALIADDLRGLLPGVEEARLAVVGAMFDAVELLRPGFPLYATLDELARRVPRVTSTGGVVSFGTHEGHMPAEPLTPDPVYADGPMRLLPWTLLAPAELAESLSEQMEIALVGRGEAGTATSDFLMRTLGARLEHARYLSRDDLLALTCVQYEHVNLAPMWTLLEAALLTPYREETALGARGLPMRYAEGKVSVAAPAAWFARSGQRQGDPAHEFAGVMFELRQYSAVLGAHRLPLVMDGDTSDADAGFLLETIAGVDDELAAPALFAHEAPGLGVVAVTVAQPRAGHAHVLAHAYPLSAQALGPMVATLASRYPSADDLNMLGRVLLDTENRLSAPPGSSLH